MLTAAELAQIQSEYPMLTQLPPALVAHVQREAIAMKAPAGHILFDIDDSCSSFVMVLSGVIRVIRPTLSGREILLYRVQPGDSCILTVSCLLGHASYPARGMVEEDLHLAALSLESFNLLLEKSAAFRQMVFQFFADRVHHLMELVEGVTFQPVEQRLAALLVERAPRLDVTHQMLADELGTVREVINRHLKEFERRGLVQLGRGAVIVLDATALADLGASIAE